MKPIRDELYLKWIRTLPSIVPSKSRYVEACHVGPHGMSQKASDYQTVPLSPALHRELHQRGRKAFEARYKVDLLEWANRLSAKPVLKLRHGTFTIVAWRHLNGEFHSLLFQPPVVFLKPRAAPYSKLIWELRALRTEQLVQEIQGRET